MIKPVLQHSVQDRSLVRARRWITWTRNSLLETINYMENSAVDVHISIHSLASIKDISQEQWRACDAAFEAWENILPDNHANNLDH